MLSNFIILFSLSLFQLFASEELIKCGTVKTVNKVVGGNESKIFEHPWTVPLYFKSANDGLVEVRCGGTLINKRYVVTAAHCVDPVLMPGWDLEMVKLGVWNISATKECSDDGITCADHQSVGIEEIIIHENFSSTSRHRENDIALLRLNTEIQYSNFIRPICLLPKTISHKVRYPMVTVIGWGKTEHHTTSNWKMQVNLFLMKQAKCQRIYAQQIIDANKICAGGEFGKDSCNGDSGGPLVAEDNLSDPNETHYYLAGIVSYGVEVCGTDKRPGVYTNVSKYVPWINSKLRP